MIIIPRSFSTSQCKKTYSTHTALLLLLALDFQIANVKFQNHPKNNVKEKRRTNKCLQNKFDQNQSIGFRVRVRLDYTKDSNKNKYCSENQVHWA